MFPLLVWCAKHGMKISYGQTDAELQRRGWGHHVHAAMYGYPAGAIGSALLDTEEKRGQKIPPLNALVVNANTGIPGDGCDYYLSNYLNGNSKKKLSNSQRRSMAEETIEEVWRFEGWDEIIADYGLNPTNQPIPGLDVEFEPKAPRKDGWTTGPESEAHKALKNWVAKHPGAIKSKIKYKTGTVEWLFASSDRADVMFSHGQGWTAAEVKSLEAPDAELERGIYQCVKYQALLRAELKAMGKVPAGYAVLVTERHLSASLQTLADLLGVRFVTVRRQ
jgi:hypothetical protein